MDIQGITAISLLEVHGSIQYMCDQYKITYTEKKKENFKRSFGWRRTTLSAKFLYSSLGRFFLYHLKTKIDFKNFQEFLKQNEINDKYG